MTGDRMRDEAERLVAAAIAAVSYAARGLSASSRPGLATGSAECCVCPVCRAIAALREPGPEVADRLASGVGDLAASVSAILRALSQRSGYEPAQESPTREGDEFWESLRRRAADAAKAAAKATATVHRPSGSTVDEDPWHAATATTPAQTSAASAANGSAMPRKTAAKKAVPTKTVPTKAVPKKVAPPRPAPADEAVTSTPVAKKATATKAMAKKAVAKKAVAKKAPGRVVPGAAEGRA